MLNSHEASSQRNNIIKFTHFNVTKRAHNKVFRFMVDPGHCPAISKYGPLLSKVVGPVDPSFLVVKISRFNKKYSSYSESMNSTKKSTDVVNTLKHAATKKDKTKTLITNGSLMKVKRITGCWSILQYF